MDATAVAHGCTAVAHGWSEMTHDGRMPLIVEQQGSGTAMYAVVHTHTHTFVTCFAAGLVYVMLSCVFSHDQIRLARPTARQHFQPGPRPSSHTHDNTHVLLYKRMDPGGYRTWRYGPRGAGCAVGRAG
eukprot:226017-Chlamydomonas_euryale.AAC.2